MITEKQKKSPAYRNKIYREKLLAYIDGVNGLNDIESNRLKQASDFWWSYRGTVPSDAIADEFNVRNNALTNFIQQQISERSEVPIVNATPVVTIENTLETLDYKYPPSKFNCYDEVSLEFYAALIDFKNRMA